jgi:putative copper export protein
VATLIGGALGAFVHILLEPAHLPAMGFVIGGLLMFAFNEAVRPE